MNWLKQRRRELGLSQDELAARLQTEGLDIERSAVSAWEAGRNKPKLGDAHYRRALSKVLKLSEQQLLLLAGYEIPTSHSVAAERAASIVEQLTPDKQELAVKLLEQLLPD